MDFEEILKAGQNLAKACWLLTDQPSDGPVCGSFGGTPVKQDRGELSHIITVDCQWLSQHGYPLTGTISVTDFMADEEEDDDDEGSYRLIVDPSGRMSPGASSTLLYAKTAVSLPPIEGIFVCGGDAVGDWLARRGWKRNVRYNNNFREPGAKQYCQYWLKQNPVHTKAAFAVVGGWHMPWEYGDWYDRLSDRLVFCTVRGAEPWLEVFQNKSGVLKEYVRFT